MVCEEAPHSLDLIATSVLSPSSTSPPASSSSLDWPLLGGRRPRKEQSQIQKNGGSHLLSSVPDDGELNSRPTLHGCWGRAEMRLCGYEQDTDGDKVHVLLLHHTSPSLNHVMFTRRFTAFALGDVTHSHSNVLWVMYGRSHLCSSELCLMFCLSLYNHYTSTVQNSMLCFVHRMCRSHLLYIFDEGATGILKIVTNACFFVDNSFSSYFARWYSDGL